MNIPHRQNFSITAADGGVAGLVDQFSIEVTPATAAKVNNFRDILPLQTRVYIAHIDGTPLDQLITTARRLTDEGFVPMPHIPARQIANKAMLTQWLKRYTNEAGVQQALIIAGGNANPYGDFDSSMQLLETGLFDQFGFTHLHVAGHPEGNKDIDRDGSTRLVDEAALWKQQFSQRTDASMALVTQFAFDAKPLISWANRLWENGIDLPVHIGVAGPAKLQTLIKFAITCGVGASVSVLQKRARDITRLLLPYQPDTLLADLAQAVDQQQVSHIAGLHFFPLGGIKATAQYLGELQGH